MHSIFYVLLIALISIHVSLPVPAGYCQPIHPESKSVIPAAVKPESLEKTASKPAGTRANRVDDKQDLMDEALELINESENSWRRGDMEIALDFLDQAYALLLSANGNASISRQKDDLRLLISRRILAIYSATKFTVTNGKASQIPLVLNEDVEKEIRSFQTVERNFFLQSYRRSATFLPFIVSELKKAGLPLELAWLPLVESGYKIGALSSARALGLWQFIPSTGYQYGLSRNEWIDERMDIEKSTRAAIAYLSELHGMFGDWLTALAAYNCGEGRLLRVISRQRINYFDRFWDLYHQLPYETARYVPRFLATLHIINDPARFGFDLASEQPDKKLIYAYEKIKVNKSMRLVDIAEHTETPEELLNILNAELRRKITPNSEYELKLPPDAAQKFWEVQDNIPILKMHPKKIVRHRIKKGETIEAIAKTYGVPSRSIRESNPRAAKQKLAAGKIIRIPINEDDTFTPLASGSGRDEEMPRKSLEPQKTPAAALHSKRLNQRAEDRNVRVAKAGSVAGDVRSTSANKPSNKMEPASSKKQKDNQPVPDVTYVIQKGDSLNNIAKKYNTSAKTLAKINNITDQDNIQPGKKILVR